MSYLLDTNVVCELVRPKPSESVIRWFNEVPNESLFISVLTLGEIRKGIENIEEAKRKERLRLWLEVSLPQWFGERVLVIETGIAERWGRLQSEMKNPVAVIDSLLAATALHHDLRMVTRNERDFIYPSLSVLNPWY